MREEGGGGGGEGEVWEKRSKNVRFMELGKLKVIKSEDYSTAKLSKFLREVEGFSLVLNREALGGCNIHYSPFIFTPFIPFCSPFFSRPSVFLANLTVVKLLLNSCSEKHSALLYCRNMQ